MHNKLNELKVIILKYFIIKGAYVKFNNTLNYLRKTLKKLIKLEKHQYCLE